jgi:uncharacterized protein (TIGR02246 family)
MVFLETMRLLIVALLGISSVFFHSLAAEPDDAAFQPLLKTFLDSWNKHDAHAFAEIFTADAVITTVGANRVDGLGIEKRMQPSFTGPTFKDSVYSATIKSARRFGPDLAVLDLDWEMTGARKRDGSSRGLRKGTLNWVVVQKGGRWKITNYHNSELPQPQGTPAQ